MFLLKVNLQTSLHVAKTRREKLKSHVVYAFGQKFQLLQCSSIESFVRDNIKSNDLDKNTGCTKISGGFDLR